MFPYSSLLAPVVVSAVLVFVVSSILHMVLKYHRSDYKPLPDEAGATAALRSDALTPGLYVFPYCQSQQDMAKPEMMEKYTKGPVGFVTVLASGPPKMGKYLALWFTFSLLVSFFVAYLAGHTMEVGAHYLAVFRVTGTAAFLAYGLSPFVDSVWKGQPWSNTVKAMCDGLVYALVTAGAFGWLWPR